MNEYKQFEEVIKGLRNVIKIDDTKKEIQELERKLDDKKRVLKHLQKKDEKYNNIANNLNNIAIDINKMPEDMQNTFKDLIIELIKLDYISIVDVYNLK